MIVIFNGPDGVGKTSVIQALGRRMPWMAQVDQGLLRACLMQGNHAADRFRLAQENVCALAANYLRGGYHVLIEGVFELEADLDNLSGRLVQMDPVVYRFQLRCDEDALLQRATQAGLDTERTLRQARWLDRSMEDLGMVLETGDKSTDEVADTVIQCVEVGLGRYALPGMARSRPRVSPLAPAMRRPNGGHAA